jgi:RNA polymerase sigma-70 factor, ECF subfamily
MERVMARATTVGEIAGALTIRAEETSILAELKAGSEDAYAWLIAHYHQPVYGLVYRILNDPSDAADTTQEVFLKVFRGMKNFNGEASLKTWIYRIAVHEASNQRRWWFRHKRKETSMDAEQAFDSGEGEGATLCDSLADVHDTPFDCFVHEEVRAKVESELKQVAEPYRTTVVLRDIEGLAYEEIAEILGVNLGTVKSRLMRGREALRKRLVPYVQEVGGEIGLEAPQEDLKKRAAVLRVHNVVEVRTRR